MWSACYASGQAARFVGSVQNQSWLLWFGIFLILLNGVNTAYAVPPGTVISNTADANFSVSGNPQNRASNVVDIITTVNLTPAQISFLQYSPTGAGASATNTSPTGCSTSGPAGPFSPLGNPTYPGIGVLNVAVPIDLAPAGSYHQGEPIFVRVIDNNRNLDSGVRDALVITLSSNNLGDQEALELSETDVDTGEFVGYIQSVTAPVASYDCQLAVTADDTIQASYTDIFDVTDTASTNVLVDPFGIVFDSSTGNPINGISISLVDATTGLPAAVFGDDTVSVFPSTVVTGSTVTDSGGTVYNFGPGEYRFPSVAPGTYRLEVVANAYNAPSTISIGQLQTLPNAPFALDANASFGLPFTLVVGPPLNVDIPIDSIDDLLFVTKEASKIEAAIGDFVQYEITVTNNRSSVAAINTTVIDTLPTGFKFQSGSVQINSITASDPSISSDGRSLTFTLGDIAANTTVTIKYVLEITAGTPFGHATNAVIANDASGETSNIAQAVVRVSDDLLSTRSFLLGRVTQGSCERDRTTEFGEFTYQLSSELRTNNVIHYVSIENPQKNKNQVVFNVILPKLLTYQTGSAQISGRQIADPVQTGNNLSFALDSLDVQEQLQFTTRLDLSVVGEFVIQGLLQMETNDSIATANSWVTNRFTALDSENVSELNTIEVSQAHSDKQTLTGQHTDPVVGVEGIRLFLEDGRYVLTDDRGMYHFEAIEPGTHVVQIDTASIPQHLEIHQCVNNTRFAGTSHSRFVDIEPGLLWRADFYLRVKEQRNGILSTRLESKSAENHIEYQLTLNGEMQEFKNVRASIILPQGLEYIAHSSTVNGSSTSDPKLSFGTLIYSLGDQGGKQWQQQIRFHARGVPTQQGEIITEALVTYDNGEHKNLRTSVVNNAVFYQQEKTVTQKYTLRPQFATLSAQLSMTDLDKFEEFINRLQRQTITAVRITGHTDNIPIAAANRQLFADNVALSMARAQTAAKYLQSALRLNDRQLLVQGLGDQRPIADNDTSQGRAMNRRVEIEIDSVEIIRTEQFEISQQDSGVSSTYVEGSNANTADSSQPLPKIEVLAEPEFDQAWLEQANNDLQWLFPTSDYSPSIPSVAIAIKHKREEKIILQLNGKEVSALNLDSKESSTDGQRMITRWRGIDIEEGSNHFVAITQDVAGKTVDKIIKTVHYSGRPERIEFVPEYSQLKADGRTPIVVAVRFYDRWNQPVRSGVVGRFELSPEYRTAEEKTQLDKQPLSGLLKGENRYEIDHDGIALIQIEPTTRSGKMSLDFNLSDQRQETITAWLTAEQREWILVGLAEGTAGYNNLSGNAQALDDHQHEDDLYEDGRLAFYAKGKVKGEWLLTLAYDSDRKERNSADRLFQTINPDEYYTLYGDATEQQFDAASARKLYLRIERNQFYALFGDFNTDLTITELARYDRSMTGVKSEYEGKRFAYNSFVADTDQIFVRDEIQGNGTSGLYNLSNDNLVINSEKIKLETRDRFNPQDVVVAQELQRFIDYNIDTVNGTLYFKQPVQSRDENLNPIYIVVSYEVIGADDRQVTAGGRANIYSDDKKIELGVTGISQGDTGTDGHLLGADLTYKLSQHTEFRAEIATSKTTADENDQNGSAYLAEVEHRSEQLNGRVYFRKQEEAFGLEQQSINNDGSRRYGVDMRYKLNEDLNINSELYRDEVLTTDAKRTVADIELEKTHKKYQLATGLKYAKDEFEDRDSDDSVLATARASRYFLDNKLQLRTNAEVAVDNDSSVDYPTRLLAGADYQLNEITELFTEHEYTHGEDQDSNTTRIGTRLKPWTQAEVSTSVEQQANEDGARLFSNLGFTQGWQYNEHLRLDFSIDRSDTLRDPGGQAFNTNVPLSSGTVTNDFTALSVGANYTQEHWSTSSRIEYRTSDQDIQRGILFGLYREQRTGFGMALNGQLFDVDSKSGSDDTLADMRYSLAYRPSDSAFTVLNRLDLNYENTRSETTRIRNRKVVNNLNFNYTLDSTHQFAAHWGIKYTLDDIDGEEYDGITQLFGFQYRRDINDKLDLSLHGDILHSSNADNFRYSFGPALGVNVYKNAWLSVGYNIDGFEDEDFSSAEYTASGPFLKLRIKFDSSTVKGLLNK